MHSCNRWAYKLSALHPDCLLSGRKSQVPTEEVPGWALNLVWIIQFKSTKFTFPKSIF